MFENGSTYLKIDSHLHTQSDKEFSFDGPDNTFINDYVEALVNKDIKVGFITNHNKFELSEFKALKRRAQKEDIYLLPGVELSVKEGANGIHVLIIFKYEDWIVNGKDSINIFLDAAFIGVTGNRGNENTRCKYDLNGMFAALDEYNADYFIIPAHVEQNSGLFKECDGGLINTLSRNPQFKNKVLALQKVRTRDKYAKFIEWTGLDIPNIEGSDPKKIGSIGSNLSYIKIGEYSFDAIKYALIANTDRLSPNIILNKHAYIENITVKGGKLDGQCISLSPHLNCLIGIRGSGKSSVLEIIRKVLGKSATCDDRYKDDLVNYIIGSGGKVEIVAKDKFGNVYTFSYINGERVNIFDQTGSLVNVTTDAIISRPLYFGQKDLSFTQPGYEFGLLNKLIGDKVSPFLISVHEIEKEIAKKIEEYTSLSEHSEKIQQIEERNGNLNHFLKIFEDHGVAEKLKKQSSYILDQQQITNIIKISEQLVSDKAFSSLLTSTLDEISACKSYVSEFNQEFFDGIRTILNSLETNIRVIAGANSTLNAPLLQLKAKEIEFNGVTEGLKDEFAEIRREIHQPDIDPDKFLEYKQELESNKKEIDRIKGLLGKKTELRGNIINLLDKRNRKLLEIYEIYNDEITKINGSQTELKIDIEFKGDKSNFLSSLKTEFKGTGLTDTKYRIISEEYSDICGFIIDVVLDSTKSQTKEILTSTELGKILIKIQENSYELISTRTQDKVSIEYHGKSLEKHSIGQRASALILFILAQEMNDLIIIDQPEDDLDNQVIYSELIHRIKKRKADIQFIFATHNANIPVLGDSEKITSCAYSDDRIILEQGNIDKNETQNAIISIMEGGIEAFEKRKRIYSVWR